VPDPAAMLDAPGQLAVSFIDASGCARLNPHDLADVRKALADAVKWRITVLEQCRSCRRDDGLCARHAASMEAIEVYRSLAARLAPKDGLRSPTRCPRPSAPGSLRSWPGA